MTVPPGTGKTVVALHRARFFAEHGGADARPVLLTTFSRVLASQLEDGARMVCRDIPELARRINTLTLVEAARTVLKGAGVPSALLLQEDIDAAWAEALRDGEGRGRKFYAAERDEVVLAHAVDSEDAYLKVSRARRKERLDRADKREVWAVLERFEAALTKRGGDDAGGLARRATRLLQDGTAKSPFAAVVCDEVQDASLYELRLLAALAGGQLFLVGDGHQRLYQRPISLRAAGIEVRGRSARLKLNYRTTQGICSAALAVLDGVEADLLDTVDGDASASGGSTTDGYRSVRAGDRPQKHRFGDAEKEADFIAQSIRETDVRPFLILMRTRKAIDALQERLRSRGITTTTLADTDALPEGDHVILATLHRSKGLECPRVILAGMQDVPQRFPGGSAQDKELWQKKERLLVYVGMTRARDRCAQTSVEATS